MKIQIGRFITEDANIYGFSVILSCGLGFGIWPKGWELGLGLNDSVLFCGF